jgi:uncharacterized protein
MYQASAPQFIRMLDSLSAILDKAQAHAESRKIDPATLTTFRLYPDMFPLARQVQIACDAAKGAVARLAGVEVPRHEDTEQTFAELKTRIAKTIAFIESIKPAQIDGSEDREIALQFLRRELRLTGLKYLLSFAQPHFYFHVTTAYNILRHNGVEIGKMEYLGQN